MQQNIFLYKMIGETSDDILLKESFEIVQKAIIDNNPYAIVLMLSGGDDSITALHTAKMLGVKIDFILHGITGTGLPAVREYVAGVAEKYQIKIIYADAGNAFEDYVMRKGFFGRGKHAHQYSYHVLKNGPFEKAVAKYITKRIPHRKIILLNGVRVEESENRSDNYGDNPYTFRKNLIWVNIIHWFTKADCLRLLENENVIRSHVAITLGRSAECNCGTMESEADRIAAYNYDPAFGEYMMLLRKKVTAKFGWDIGQQPNKKTIEQIKSVNKTLIDFMPMCVGCKTNFKQQVLFK